MVEYYANLLTGAHVPAFESAIRRAVRPDDVVVDLGCGVGTYAILAARAGARRVFGVELGPVIGFAQQVAERNGANVEFLAADARDVTLPEPATLLIFEDYSTDLLGGSTGQLLQTVRDHWMAPEHRILPFGADLKLAPICSLTAREDNLPLEKHGSQLHDLDFSPLRDAAHNTLHRLQSPSGASLLAEPQTVLEQRFSSPFPQSWSTRVRFKFEDAGDLDGVCLWHDLLLDEETKFSNTPTEPAIWGQYLLATPERWAVQPGDELRFELTFQAALDDGFWSWSFELTRQAEPSQPLRFCGNTFAGSPLTGKNLHRHRVDEVVRLTQRAHLEALVLSLVDGKRTMEQIAQEVQRETGMPEPGEVLELVQSHLESRKALAGSA